MITAQYVDTRCQGVIIEGAFGEVNILTDLNLNTKSFAYKGTVDKLNTSDKIEVIGTAKFWKTSKDGSKDYYKSGVSAVLSVSK